MAAGFLSFVVSTQRSALGSFLFYSLCAMQRFYVAGLHDLLPYLYADHTQSDVYCSRRPVADDSLADDLRMRRRVEWE